MPREPSQSMLLHVQHDPASVATLLGRGHIVLTVNDAGEWCARTFVNGRADATWAPMPLQRLQERVLTVAFAELAEAVSQVSRGPAP